MPNTIARSAMSLLDERVRQVFAPAEVAEVIALITALDWITHLTETSGNSFDKHL
jgi:hypothetical protein